MEVKFKKQTKYSLDGVTEIKANVGDVKVIPSDSIREKFCQYGWCELVGKSQKEPQEDKSLKEPQEDKSLKEPQEDKSDDDFFGDLPSKPAKKGRGRK